MFDEHMERLKRFYQIEPLSDPVKINRCIDHGYNDLLEEVEPKECYRNIFRILCDHKNFKEGKAKYVLGYAFNIVPIDHAWLKIGELYFDPTWERHREIGKIYLPFFELDLAEVMTWANQHRSYLPTTKFMADSKPNRGRQ